MISLTIDGVVQEATSGERLIDVINRTGVQISQVCYHRSLVLSRRVTHAW